MKFKMAIVLAVFVSLTVGFFLSRYETSRYWQKQFDFDMAVHDSNNVKFYIEALDYLHAGKRGDALALLDSRLDYALILPLGTLARSKSHPEEVSPSVMGALKA